MDFIKVKSTIKILKKMDEEKKGLGFNELVNTLIPTIRYDEFKINKDYTILLKDISNSKEITARGGYRYVEFIGRILTGFEDFGVNSTQLINVHISKLSLAEALVRHRIQIYGHTEARLTFHRTKKKFLITTINIGGM